MEATGVYWLNLYLMLKDAGIDVILANPLQVKNLMDKKTDEADAEWLMLMHSYGMVKPSFQPENITRKIRNLTRHRSSLLESASVEILHMQKAMEMMNIKLSTVISDVTGKSGQGPHDDDLPFEERNAHLGQPGLQLLPLFHHLAHHAHVAIHPLLFVGTLAQTAVVGLEDMQVLSREQRRVGLRYTACQFRLCPCQVGGNLLLQRLKHGQVFSVYAVGRQLLDVARPPPK